MSKPTSQARDGDPAIGDEDQNDPDGVPGGEASRAAMLMGGRSGDFVRSTFSRVNVPGVTCRERITGRNPIA
jgi:hypothetical protein